MCKASNGELAWPLERAGEAATWIASKGLAILGGEAWLVGPPAGIEGLGGIPPWGHDEAGRIIMGVIPVTGSSAPAVRGWTDVKAKQQGEPWSVFVARCLSQALAGLQGEAGRVDEEVPANVRHLLRYNMAFVSEQEYAKL